ncbi:MAG: biotin/lipoyl-containing protein [Cypionkella sp.]|nr:biotin/lipoyl-containing protein [Cypionkella sp.]
MRIILEIETDKAVMEQDSFFDGTLLYIGVQEGETVVENKAVLAVIGEEGEDYKAAIAAALSNSGDAPVEAFP